MTSLVAEMLQNASLVEHTHSRGRKWGMKWKEMKKTNSGNLFAAALSGKFDQQVMRVARCGCPLALPAKLCRLAPAPAWSLSRPGEPSGNESRKLPNGGGMSNWLEAHYTVRSLSLSLPVSPSLSLCVQLIIRTVRCNECSSTLLQSRSPCVYLIFIAYTQRCAAFFPIFHA